MLENYIEDLGIEEQIGSEKNDIMIKKNDRSLPVGEVGQKMGLITRRWQSGEGRVIFRV
jgi:hypothetical protein